MYYFCIEICSNIKKNILYSKFQNLIYSWMLVTEGILFVKSSCQKRIKFWNLLYMRINVVLKFPLTRKHRTYKNTQKLVYNNVLHILKKVNFSMIRFSVWIFETNLFSRLRILSIFIGFDVYNRRIISRFFFIFYFCIEKKISIKFFLKIYNRLHHKSKRRFGF